jgi:hypothetical protein
LEIRDDPPDVYIHWASGNAAAATYAAKRPELLRKIEQLVTEALAEASSLICSGVIAAGDASESF